MALVRLTTQFDDPRRAASVATPTCCCCCCCCVASIASSTTLAAVEANHLALVDGVGGSTRSLRIASAIGAIPAAAIGTAVLANSRMPGVGWLFPVGYGGMLALAFGLTPGQRIGRAAAQVALTFAAAAAEVAVVLGGGLVALSAGRSSNSGAVAVLFGLAYLAGAVAIAVAIGRSRAATLARRRDTASLPDATGWPPLPPLPPLPPPPPAPGTGPNA